MTMTSTRAAILALCLAVAPGGALFAERYSAMFEIDRFEDSTKELVFKHAVPGDATGTALKVSIKLREGEAVCQLRDAEGRVRWERTLDEGSFYWKERFEGAPGQWEVHLELRNATGRYNISLQDFE